MYGGMRLVLVKVSVSSVFGVQVYSVVAKSKPDTDESVGLGKRVITYGLNRLGDLGRNIDQVSILALDALQP